MVTTDPDHAPTDGAPHAVMRPRRHDPLLLRFVRFMSRLTRPLAGRRFFPLWAVLRHQGRRSGREYAVPVGVRETGDGFVIGLPFGDRTQWVYNVMAAGSCTLRWRDEDLRLVDPVIVGFDEAGAEYPWLLRLMIRAVNVRQFLRLRRAAT